MSVFLAEPPSRTSSAETLPRGWRWGTINETGRYVNGVAFKPQDWTGEGLPIIRIQNLTDPAKPLNRTPRKVDDIYRIESGDLLVSWSATLDAFLWDREPALLNQHIFKVIPDTAVTGKRFLFYLLRLAISDMLKTEHLHGSTMKHINRGPFLAHRVPVPPLDEQQRIVAEIEKQFTRLEAGVASLKRVQAALKRYRASVLKAACEGRLVPTEAELARRESRPYEPATTLLARILKERRGKDKEPIAPEMSALATLPEGWTWASLDQVAADRLIGLDRGRAQQNAHGEGVPYIKMNNVTMDGRVNGDELMFVPASTEERARYSVRDGDLLFNTRNSVELVGKVGLVRNPPAGAIYNNNLLRLRVSESLLPSFLCAQMCSHSFRQRMELVKKATTSVAAVYARGLVSTPARTPPPRRTTTHRRRSGAPPVGDRGTGSGGGGQPPACHPPVPVNPPPRVQR